MPSGPLSQISELSDGRSKRISSFDRTGGNRDHTQIAPGETLVMADLEGAGVITHVWITISSKDPLARRNLVLRAYWDDQEHPSIESPIGDFFGQGWGETYLFQSLGMAAAPKDGNALVCYLPMPFSKRAQLTVENQGDIECGAFYYYLDYEELESLQEGQGRLHAWYNQELTTPESDFGDRENEWATLGETSPNTADACNYLFCEAEGKGHFLGVHYYVNSPGPIWYGEGDDMFCIDGEPWPFSLHGTGTEDYFNMSWSPDEAYQHPYFGCARAPGRGNADSRFGWLGRTHCYRFHFEDPVRFRKSLRASIEHGHANNLTLEIASVAFWYQDLPSRPFPTLPGAAERAPRAVTSPVDVHRWRDAWRSSKSSGPRWGNE